ncbi:hypothetical protein HGA13_29790 [Nocardia speluncae]|uniref:Uncharacterized protein n=1 Tax=Nocardia speluncae TaxID=419477 RepID=A0A846XRW4_9NOCA|nr:hypothetical protein [Nocardia speluncae]NKY37233.1 hypothetical protein [Nocardia speluncae]
MAGAEQVDPADSAAVGLEVSPSQGSADTASAEGHDVHRGCLGELPGARGGVSASFEIRYVDGGEGERRAAVQAKAIAELLVWLRDHGDGGGVS